MTQAQSTATTSAGTAVLDPTAVDELRETVRGPVLSPQNTGYEEARQLYNGMIDKRPAVIARCTDVADVISAVNYGRENDLLVAIRGGGHNGPGLGSCDGGLVIDLSAMNGVRVDPEKRTVRAGPGCIQADVEHAGHAFGLAVPAGIVAIRRSLPSGSLGFSLR